MSTDPNDPLVKALRATYDPVLDEPVPPRLSALLAERAGAASDPAAATPGAEVVNLAERREALLAARAQAAAASRGHLTGHTTRPWARWGGLAASVATVGLLALYFQGPSGLNTANPVSPQVAQALDSAPSGQARQGVQVAFSFRNHQGQWCRAYTEGAEAGLACKQGPGAQWALVARAPHAPAEGQATGLRMAATPLPPALLQAIDAQQAQAALDAAQERIQLQRGWNPSALP